jgi:hypothetical protein
MAELVGRKVDYYLDGAARQFDPMAEPGGT